MNLETELQQLFLKMWLQDRLDIWYQCVVLLSNNRQPVSKFYVMVPQNTPKDTQKSSMVVYLLDRLEEQGDVPHALAPAC
jgi:hypothetical protein